MPVQHLLPPKRQKRQSSVWSARHALSRSCNMHLPVAPATAGERLVLWLPLRRELLSQPNPIVAASRYSLYTIQQTSLNHTATLLQYLYTVSPLISLFSLVRLVTMPHAKRLASHAQPIVAGRCLHMHYSSSDVQAFRLCCPSRHRLCKCASVFASNCALAHSPTTSILPRKQFCLRSSHASNHN